MWFGLLKTTQQGKKSKVSNGGGSEGHLKKVWECRAFWEEKAKHPNDSEGDVIPASLK